MTHSFSPLLVWLNKQGGMVPAKVFLAVVVLGLVSAPATLALHQLKTAQTVLSKNSRTSMLEVVHRFYVHDAEHAINSVTDTSGDIIKDPAVRAAFIGYVNKKFSLSAMARPIPLTLVGSEVKGQYLYIYQEVPLARLSLQQGVPFALKFTHAALQDIWESQLNMVLLEGFGDTQSFVSRKEKPSFFFTLTL